MKQTSKGRKEKKQQRNKEKQLKKTCTQEKQQ